MDLAAILALEALGGKLDRGERVLDLVRDATRDIGPGGIALGGDEVGDVVEGQHMAVRGVFGTFRRHPREQASAFALALDVDLAFGEARGPGQRLLEDRQEGFERHLGRFADEIAFAAAQQVEARAVDQRDAARRIDADDAGADACEHRLGEAAARVDRVAGKDQIVALLLQVIGHQVEGIGQGLEILRALDHGHLGVEFAARHAPCGIEQTHHRGHHLVREPKAHPDGGEQQDEADEREHHAEGQLHAESLRHQPVIFTLGLLRVVQLLLNGRIDDAVDHQVGVGEVGQLDQATDDIAALPRLDHHKFALVGLFERGGAGREEGEAVPRHDARDELLLAVLLLRGIEDEDRRQPVQQGVVGHTADEIGAVVVVEVTLLRQVGSDLRHVVAHRLAMVVHVGFGHIDRRIHDGTGTFREPRIEAAVERHGGEDGHHDGRHDGDEAEQRDEAELQRGARRAVAPLDQQEDDLPEDQERQHQQHRTVDQHQQEGIVGGGDDRRHAGQDGEGRQAAGHARQDEHETEHAREAADAVEQPDLRAFDHATCSAEPVARNQH